MKQIHSLSVNAPHEPPSLRVAVTGGSASGKSYLIALARQQFPALFHALPEAATQVLSKLAIDQTRFDRTTRERVQLEIYHRQIAMEKRAPALPFVLCDRGTIDASSYWPAGPSDFWRVVATTEAQELERYAAVIWLESSAAVGEYQRNPVRTEDATESLAHGEVLLRLWRAHPRLFVLRATVEFSTKIQAFFQILNDLRPIPAA